MASQYGVNTVTSVNAARPIRINSSTPIGCVGTVLLPADTTGMSEEHVAIFNKIKANEPLFFGSADTANEFFADFEGTMREAVDGIADQNVNSPLILVCVELESIHSGKVAENFYDDLTLKSKIIAAINSLKGVAGLVGYKPNLIVAPRFSHDLDVSTEMTSVAQRLLAMAIVDMNAADESAAALMVSSFGTSRVLLCDPYVKVWDTLQDKEVMQPVSARRAGLIAWTDGQWEYGFADSHSNRVINGISGTSRTVEFNAGQDCEADRLRTAGIGTVIRYNGFRMWGGETTDIDPIWQDHTRVRVFDRISEAALDGLFWAIDRRADILKSVKDSVEQMLLALKGSRVLLGFNVYWDPEKNTKANITAGKFYLVAEMQNMPIVKRLEVNFSYVDRYGDVLIKMIS
ncbi:MAG: phage tail sheath subtilisin-like domain-containing protein [Sulfurospirillum sp.]|nr:phage tail sheath subtilisin-like domain-containing protein [Sulfurospirillum sp.]